MFPCTIFKAFQTNNEEEVETNATVYSVIPWVAVNDIYLFRFGFVVGSWRGEVQNLAVVCHVR